ncbi:MAG: hypothetical protein Q9180_002936 [Flavoplaca navasiana]
MSVNSALKPPPGQVVDYVHSESIGHRVVEASLSTIALATIAVVLRLIVKLRITKSAGWDDSAPVVNIWGVGHHSWNVPLANYEPMLNVGHESVSTETAE